MWGQSSQRKTHRLESEEMRLQTFGTVWMYPRHLALCRSHFKDKILVLSATPSGDNCIYYTDEETEIWSKYVFLPKVIQFCKQQYCLSRHRSNSNITCEKPESQLPLVSDERVKTPGHEITYLERQSQKQQRI